MNMVGKVRSLTRTFGLDKTLCALTGEHIDFGKKDDQRLISKVPD